MCLCRGWKHLGNLCPIWLFCFGEHLKGGDAEAVHIIGAGVILGSSLGTFVEFGRDFAVTTAAIISAAATAISASNIMTTIVVVGIAVDKVVGLQAQGFGHVGGLVVGHDGFVKLNDATFLASAASGAWWEWEKNSR